MNSTLSYIHRYLTSGIALTVFIQLFLAGLWHAETVTTPNIHVFIGLGMVVAALLALIAAIAGKTGKQIIGMTALLFVLILLQPVLIEQRRSGIPFLSAFHTLNAGFIGALSGAVAAAASKATAAFPLSSSSAISAAD